MRMSFSCLAGILFGLVVCGQRAQAVIKVDTPLKSIEGYAKYILVGKVDKFFADKPAMMVTVSEDIKGKAPFRQIPFNCKVDDPKTVKDNFIEPLLKRLGPDLDIVFFITPRGNSFIVFAYTNGTWFQALGTRVGEPDKVVFSLKSAEPYYRKSFKGTTAELRKLLKDHVERKAPLPPLDGKVDPGFGPEYTPQQKTERPRSLDVFLALTQPLPLSSHGSLLAVIPTLGIGAPLAILAMLFPTVFGGVFVLFRQWMAFIMLISLNSTLMLLHWWLAPKFLRGTWWSTDASLWFLMTLFTFACMLWAWRRQLNFLYSGDAEAPKKTEQSVLLIMTASCLLTSALMWYLAKPSWIEVGWALTVVMTLGIAAGTLYKFSGRLQRATIFLTPALATEGVILGVMLMGHVCFAPAIWGGNISTLGSVDGNEQKALNPAKIDPVVKKWDFIIEAPGMFASSPLVHEDSVYAAYSETTPKNATLVRLDRQTGQKKWEFLGKDDDLVQMISTPCIADGRLYFGEGFHDDKNCKVYCVDADSGKEVWRFVTAGQTESSPAVARGKVYIGAGNDGVYCLNAKSGEKIWKYPPSDYKGRLLRFGGGMSVVGNRLYCGSAVDRNQTKDKGETASFCFDADTGKLLWQAPAPYPVWSTPVVKDRFVYITSGNGDVFDDAPTGEVPGGAVQCLDAETGKEVWRFKVNNGIMEAPALDAHWLYFSCRDGQVYCINRRDGKERWRRFLDSPIIGTPALDLDRRGERAFSLFVAASGGKVCCMNPRNGDIEWTYNLAQQKAYISTAPRLLVTRTAEGIRRQLYFGTGLGGGRDEFAANRPVFFCLEEP